MFCLLPAAAYSCFAFFAGCLLMPVLPVLESGGFGAEILENSGLLITALAGLGVYLIVRVCIVKGSFDRLLRGNG